MKVLVSCCTSKNGNLYRCLRVDLGYCKKVVSCDAGYIAEILGVSPALISSLSSATDIVVGDLLLNKAGLDTLSNAFKSIKGGD